MKSSLTTKTVLAHSSNYSKGREGHKIKKITIHHMAGVMSGEQCAKLFQNSARNASANYCIGVKGDIVCNVEEENRAWTSSSKSNDIEAITIEVSNDKVGGQWTISKASWNALVKLCIDICKRYKITLKYDGTKNGTLTRHCMFANTDCPGTYFKNKTSDFVKEVNAGLITTTATNTATFKNYKVKVTAKELNVREKAGKKNKIVTIVKKNEIYTIVGEQTVSGTKWGKLKSGLGWISLSYTKKI